MDTIECITSILKNEQNVILPNQIILIDNGSNDGSYHKLEKKFPNITLLRNEKNLGFAAATNIGIKNALKAGSEYVFLLNNDTIIKEGILNKLLEVYNKDPRIGIVGATIVNFNCPNIIDNMGATINFWTGYSSFVNYGIFYGNNIETGDVDYVSGAAIMIKKEVIENIGMLSELFFIYGEDLEYCVRAKKENYRVVCTPKAKVLHKISSTVLKTSGTQNYYFHRSRFLFLRMHSKIWQIFFAPYHSLFVFFPYYIAKYMILEHSNSRKGVNELACFIMGVLDGLRFKTGCKKSVRFYTY